MKKLIVIILAALTLAFCACGAPSTGQQGLGGQSGSQVEDNSQGGGQSGSQTEDDNSSEGDQSGDNSSENEGEQSEVNIMYIYVGEHRLEATLADTAAATALYELLSKEDIVYTGEEYGGFELVGPLGHNLPADDRRVQTVSGDIMLYSGNQITIFYGSNTWAYTPLARINGRSADELRAIFGSAQSVQVRLSIR